MENNVRVCHILFIYMANQTNCLPFSLQTKPSLNIYRESNLTLILKFIDSSIEIIFQQLKVFTIFAMFSPLPYVTAIGPPILKENVYI